MGRLAQKLKSGLKLGAKIGAGVIGATMVAGAGAFALGSKASPSASTPSQDFMGGTGSIANVSTADLEKLYQTRPRLPQSDSGRFDLPVIGGAKPRQQTLMPRSDSGRFDLPAIGSASGIGSGLSQAQKDRDLALIKMLEADGV